MGRTRADLGNRQHDRVGGHRRAARDLGLERKDDFGGDGHRIDRVMRHCSVPTLADNPRAQRVSRSEHRARATGDRAAGQIGPDVECESGVGRRIVEQPLGDHFARAVVPFLPRLEHEQDLPCKAVAAGAQQAGGSGKHRRMAVMAAGVHRALCAAGEVEPSRLADRQRIHVAAQQHGARRIAVARPVEQGDEAAGRFAVADGERQASKRGLQFVASAGAIEPEFRIGVNIAAKRDGRRLFVQSRIAPPIEQVEAHSICTPAGTGLEWRRSTCQPASVLAHTSVSSTRSSMVWPMNRNFHCASTVATIV